MQYQKTCGSRWVISSIIVICPLLCLLPLVLNAEQPPPWVREVLDQYTLGNQMELMTESEQSGEELPPEVVEVLDQHTLENQMEPMTESEQSDAEELPSWVLEVLDQHTLGNQMEHTTDSEQSDAEELPSWVIEVLDQNTLQYQMERRIEAEQSGAAEPDPETLGAFRQPSDETIHSERSVRRESERATNKDKEVMSEESYVATMEDEQAVTRAVQDLEAVEKKGWQQAWEDIRGWIGKHPLIGLLILLFLLGLVVLRLSGQLVRPRWWAIASALLVVTGGIIYGQQGFWSSSSSENRVTLSPSEEKQAAPTSVNNPSQRKNEDIHRPKRRIPLNASPQGAPPTGHASEKRRDTLKGRKHPEAEKGPSPVHAKPLDREDTSTSSQTSVAPLKPPIRMTAAAHEEAVAKQTITEDPLPFAYTIHLESYSNSWTAPERVRYFNSLGLEAFSFRVDLPGKGTFDRVFIGRFASRSEAQAFQVRLEKEFNLSRGLIMSESTAMP